MVWFTVGWPVLYCLAIVAVLHFALIFTSNPLANVILRVHSPLMHNKCRLQSWRSLSTFITLSGCVNVCRILPIVANFLCKSLFQKALKLSQTSPLVPPSPHAILYSSQKPAMDILVIWTSGCWEDKGAYGFPSENSAYIFSGKLTAKWDDMSQASSIGLV